jgi:16S rRNA (guanine(966)-N(2))-methyltransferase RsmD
VRIIAGEHRGRRIAAPPGLDTRPMLDRVREAMFSTLGRRVAGAGVLDLYAGSGSLGLEALSRGARRARMIEKDTRAIAVLRENVELLGLGERVQIVRGDALRKDLWNPLLEEERTDLVFLDPPYRLVEDPESRARILECVEHLMGAVLDPAGCLVLHIPSRALDWLRTRGPWRRDERRYGSSGLLYLFADGKEAP